MPEVGGGIRVSMRDVKGSVDVVVCPAVTFVPDKKVRSSSGNKKSETFILFWFLLYSTLAKP